MNTNIQNAYDQIRKFNQIAGTLNQGDHEATLNNVELYLSLLKEELEETYDAFTENDIQELVDGACDLFVVASGLMQVLETAGVNIEKALARVCQNNIEKFPTTSDHTNNLDLQPQNTSVLFTPYGHVVYKRIGDNKVMKPTNFVPVNLAGTYPVDFFGSINGEPIISNKAWFAKQFDE